MRTKNMGKEKKCGAEVFGSGPEPHAVGTVEGVVKVHESVVAAIIRKAACSVPGVIRLAGNTLVDNIAEFVGSKKVLDRAMSIEMGDNSVSVELKIILAFGVYIPEVARNIQAKIVADIVDITGMRVNRIDVVVVDLEDWEKGDGESDGEDDRETPDDEMESQLK